MTTVPRLTAAERDAALAAFHTGQALRVSQGAKGCELMLQGSAALGELQRGGRLSRSLGGVARQAATDAAAGWSLRTTSPTEYTV